MTASPDPAAFDAAVDAIDDWCRRAASEIAIVEATERDTSEGLHRWRVRIRGEDKDVTTVHYRLGQRSLFYETFFTPEPEDDAAAFYAHLLRRNGGERMLRFWIGEENAVFLGGTSRVETVDEALLDEILGSFYETIERCFRAALRIGFPRFFRAPG